MKNINYGLREGLDYIMLPVDFLDNPQTRKLEKKYGTDGVYVVLALTLVIYQNDFYLDWDAVALSSFQQVYAPLTSTQKLKEIIKYAARHGFFDAHMLSKNRVLTSLSIQMNYVKVKFGKRNFTDVDKLYMFPEVVFYIDKRTLEKERYHNRDVRKAVENVHRGEEVVSDLKHQDVIDAPPHVCAGAISGAHSVEERRVEQSKVEESKVENYSSSNNNLNKDIYIGVEDQKISFNEKKEIWIKELLEDKAWIKLLGEYSGKEEEITPFIVPAIDKFVQFVKLTDNVLEICSKAEFSARFIGYWRYNNFTTDMEKLATGRKASERTKSKSDSRYDDIKRVRDEAMRLFKKGRKEGDL